MTTLDKLVNAQAKVYSMPLVETEWATLDNLVKSNIVKLEKRHNRIGKRVLEESSTYDVQVEDITLTETDTIDDPRLLIVYFAGETSIPRIYARTVTAITAANMTTDFFHLPTASAADHQTLSNVLQELEQTTYGSAASASANASGEETVSHN